MTRRNHYYACTACDFSIQRPNRIKKPVCPLCSSDMFEISENRYLYPGRFSDEAFYPPTLSHPAADLYG